MTDDVKGAKAESEAEGLYAATKALDPYPDVPPALLNSAHIEDYVLATGMVFPYQPDRRKSASYALRVGNRMAFFDPAAPRQTPYRTLHESESFELPPNSLVYVQTKELFQLPNYMAVRFNLHIELVHKGLLLGTGPLVDPGFSGRLLIPLHNMTANTYVLAENDELIWVEFTKTSGHPDWLPSAASRRMRGAPKANYADFPGPKTHLRMEDYFSRARRPHPSSSSTVEYPFPANAIPGHVEAARDLAQQASNEAETARQGAQGSAKEAERLRNLGIIGGLAATIAIVLPLIGLIYVSWQMAQTTVQMADGSNGKVQALTTEVRDLRKALADRDRAQAQLIEREYCAALAAKAPPNLLTSIAARLALARKMTSRSAINEETDPLELPKAQQCPR